MTTPTLFGNPPSGGAPQPAPNRALWIATAVVVAIVAVAALLLRAGLPGGKPVEAPATAAPVPLAPSALLGTFTGPAEGASGTKTWTVMIIDRIVENGGRTRFKFRLNRGGSTEVDGEGDLDGATSRVAFSGGGESWSGSFERGEGGRASIVATEPTLGVTLRLLHE